MCNSSQCFFNYHYLDITHHLVRYNISLFYFPINQLVNSRLCMIALFIGQDNKFKRLTPLFRLNFKGKR